MGMNTLSMNSGLANTVSSALQQVENDQTQNGASNSVQDAAEVDVAMAAFQADTVADGAPGVTSSQYWQVMNDLSHVGQDVSGGANNFSNDMQQLSADLAAALNITLSNPTGSASLPSASGSLPSVSISGQSMPLTTALFDLLTDILNNALSSASAPSNSTSGAAGTSLRAGGNGTSGAAGTSLGAGGNGTSGAGSSTGGIPGLSAALGAILQGFGASGTAPSSSSTAGIPGLSTSLLGSAPSSASNTDSSALATFDADAGGMVLNGASTNNANAALKDQVDQAVAAGDKTSFEAAKTAILGMLSAAGANTSAIQNALLAIEQSTTWSTNGGAAVIGSALSNAGKAAGNGDWSNSNGPTTLSTFIQAFNSRSSAATLEYDAAQVEGNLNPQSIVGHDITAEMQQAMAYADGGYNIGKDPANYGIQSSWSTMSPADINPTVSSALATFSSSAGAMSLAEGAPEGKANQALLAQVVAAVNAGDQASFNSAYSAIVKAMKAPSAGQNAQVLAALNTLSTNTQWKTDGGKAVIANNIQHAADALDASDWQSGANPADIATFINDFNAGVPYSTLSSDAAKIAGDLNSTDLSTNLSSMVTQALNYAQNNPNYNPKTR